MDTSDKKYDLIERTSIFAERVRNYALRLTKNTANIEYAPRLIRPGVRPVPTILKQMKDYVIRTST